MDVEVSEMHEDESERYRTYTLALAQGWSEDSVSLEFQRDLRDPDDPRAWQPPMYCVVNSRHDASYGGVTKATWHGTRVELEFTPNAVAELNLAESNLVLVLGLTPDDLQRVKSGLVRVLTYGPQDVIPQLVGFN